MAAVTIAAAAIPRSMVGYNYTDSVDFTTLVSGVGNGVEFTFDSRDIVVLRNDSGASLVFTVKAKVPTGYSTYSVTLTDPTITVANGKDVFMRLGDIFQDASGNVTIECDGAGKVLVLGY